MTNIARTSPRPHFSQILACAAVLGFPIGISPAHAATGPVTKTEKKLAPGIILTQEIDTKTPLLIDVVTVDLAAPGVTASIGIGQDHIGGTDPTAGREDVSRFARRHHALVAVNGDFFPYTGDPLGIGIHEGELFSEPWMGNGKGGPREVFGILTDDHRAIIDKLGFRGDLTAPNGRHLTVHGVDRVVGKDEVVAITPLFRGAKVNRPGGTDVILTGVNLPLRANKIMQGKVLAIRTTPDGVDTVPADGMILSGGPGRGGALLTSALHPGDAVDVVMGVGAVDNPSAGIKVAELPRDGDLPSRSGAEVDRTAWTWGRVTEALGGGPRLLTNGEVTIDGPADGFDPGFVGFPNPRTAVGLSADGKHLYIVTVDGRQSISRGVSLIDLALILKRYGASDAMNLDGGGSTVMAIAGVTVDSPGGAGSERPVADMLVVSSDRPTVEIPNWDPAGRAPEAATAPASQLQIASAKDKVEEGQSTLLTLKDGTRTIEPTQVIWQGPVTRLASAGSSGDDSPIGFVDQRGNFTALRAGAGVVTAVYQGRLVNATITAVPKPSAFDLAAIQATLTKAAAGPDNRGILAIHVIKPDGAPVANAELTISVTGGKPDVATVTTDLDGMANVGILWTGASGGLVTVGPGPHNAGGPTLLSVTLGQ